MGYTTKFYGAFQLSRALTFSEAKTLLDFNEYPEKFPTKLKSYMQWVPTADLSGICWDQNGQYDYEDSASALFSWLATKGVLVDGEVIYQGEDADDGGVLRIVGGFGGVLANARNNFTVKRPQPLTRRMLANMVLETV